MSDGVVTVIREPGAIRVIVSPSWRGTVETEVPGARPVVMARGPLWLRVTAFSACQFARFGRLARQLGRRLASKVVHHQP